MPIQRVRGDRARAETGENGGEERYIASDVSLLCLCFAGDVRENGGAGGG